MINQNASSEQKTKKITQSMGTSTSAKANSPSGSTTSLIEEKTNLLVKAIAQSGFCSRRKAEALIKCGDISVNNFVITNPAHEISKKDVIRFKKKVIDVFDQPEFIYIIMNKPSNTLCTATDPEGRQTIFDFLSHPKIKKIRLYSAGRLDRNTTGALIITNDGTLAQKLTHPSFEVKKVYAVTLNRPLTEETITQIRRGIKLEDGFIRVDSIETVNKRVMDKVIVSIHSGKNRIIKRIFEQIGFFVTHLDRISFGSIAKKGLAKGEYRFLSKKETSQLLQISKN